MVKTKQRPFDLPKEPVDKHEVRWWSLTYHDVPEVVAHRAVYHVSTTWEQVVADDDRPGSPFVDQWQVFRNDHFTGRGCGWTNAWVNSDWDFDYASEFAARAAAAESCQKRIAARREEIVKLEAALATLTEVRVGDCQDNCC